MLFRLHTSWFEYYNYNDNNDNNDNTNYDDDDDNNNNNKGTNKANTTINYNTCLPSVSCQRY